MSWVAWTSLTHIKYEQPTKTTRETIPAQILGKWFDQTHNSQKPKSPFSLQMKRTPSHLNFPSPSNQRRQNLNLQHGYTNKHNHTTHSSVLDYVKGAAKKVAGVFTKLLFRRRKHNHPEEILMPDSSGNTAPVRGASCEFSDFILF